MYPKFIRYGEKRKTVNTIRGVKGHFESLRDHKSHFETIGLGRKHDLQKKYYFRCVVPQINFRIHPNAWRGGLKSKPWPGSGTPGEQSARRGH